MKTLIGIDPGVETGFAMTVGGVFTELASYSFWHTIARLKAIKAFVPDDVRVYIENPNVNKPVFVKRGAQNELVYRRIAQNVGSNKRDAEHIIEFCKLEGIDCVPVPPLKGRFHKPNADMFNRLTGCKGKTNQHMRDAGMLIAGRKF